MPAEALATAGANRERGLRFSNAKSRSYLLNSNAPVSQAAATFGPTKAHFKVGLQLYSVRDDCAKDFDGTLKAVAKMGYEGVEFAGFFGKTPDDVRRMLKEDHLRCFGAHVQLEDLQGDNFQKTVDYHRALGNKLLIIPALAESRRKDRPALMQTAQLFSDIANRLQTYGITLAFHDEADMFKTVDGEAAWLIFMKSVDPKVAIEFDTGNALEGGAQAAPYVAQFPGRVISVHMKDYSSKNPQVLLGDGEEDWKDLIPLLKGKAGTRNFIVEQETYPFPPLESAEKCLSNFRRLMATY